MAKVELKEYRLACGNRMEGYASKIPVFFGEQEKSNDEWYGPWEGKKIHGEIESKDISPSVLKSISGGYRHYVITFDDRDVRRLPSPLYFYLQVIVNELVVRFFGYNHAIGMIHEQENPEIHLLLTTPGQSVDRQEDIVFEQRILENYMVLLMAKHSWTY